MNFVPWLDMKVKFIFVFAALCFVYVNHANLLAHESELSSMIVVSINAQDLQSAINNVPNGGVIELESGTYTAPANGFHINDMAKSFTIRPAPGAVAILDGGGQTDILRMQNSSRAMGGVVVFEDLTFRNGRTNQDGVAGGATLYNAEAIFRNCVFSDNVGQQPFSGGGGVLVALNSTVSFYNSTWDNNTNPNSGGGLEVQANSTVNVYNATFRSNRVDLPNHRNTAAGGGIHVGNSRLYVYDSLFEGNRAGYVGGAVYIIGDWTDTLDVPSANAYIVRSTFRNNISQNDASVPLPIPTEGGAFHAENQATGEIYNSIFEGNQAENGGGVNLYRAIVKVENSVFLGNRATGKGYGRGFGSAIAAVSNDTNDPTTNGGAINRRSSQLTVTNSIFRRVGVTPSQTANGIYVGGDVNRAYGQNGVAQNGTLDENRTKATIQHAIFEDMDVKATNEAPGTGVGGAITTDLADLTLQDIIVTGADAIGSNSSGGAIALLDNSLARMNKITFANNSSQTFGGALFIQGSTIEMSDCAFIANEISPGIDESGPFTSYGAAIFASIDEGRNLSSRGSISDCLFAQNLGLPIFDDDRDSTAVNAIQYNGNRFFTTLFGGTAYVNSLVGAKDVSQLNDLVVDRSGEDTKKSTIPNNALPEAPATGALLAQQKNFLMDDNEIYYLAYAWSGDSANLDGQQLSEHSGVKQCTISTCATTSSSVKHSLNVDGQTFELKIPSIADLTEKVYLPVVIR